MKIIDAVKNYHAKGLPCVVMQGDDIVRLGNLSTEPILVTTKKTSKEV